LAAIPWQGRSVYIAFDSDATENINVRWAEYHLAQALSKKGATVRIIRFASGPVNGDGKPVKVGLDDFLVTHTADKLRAMMAAASEPSRPEAGLFTSTPTTVNEADDDPHRLARLFRDDHQVKDGLTLRCWREEWYRWQAAAYLQVPKDEIKAKLGERIKREFDRLNLDDVERWKACGGIDKNGKPMSMPVARRVTVRLISDTMQALAGMVFLAAGTETPSWIEPHDAAKTFTPKKVLTCRNVLVNLDEIMRGGSGCIAPTPAFFTVNALDYDYVDNSPKPINWLAFLNKTWPEDVESIRTLQEWFGYCLLPDTSQQKILMLVGPKRSGKGTIARVLRALVGLRTTASPTLASLGTNFGLWPLVGKTIATISDARLSGRTDTAAVVENLLTISGEDARTIDRKCLAPINATLPTRFVLLTNELPRLNDASGALAGRLIILRQTKSWYGHEDTSLTTRLLAELPSILHWAIEGWQRLEERGHFVQPAAAQDLVKEMEDLTSPISAFVRELCKVGPGCEVEIKGYLLLG
jgi:putative DNA primase/helicase